MVLVCDDADQESEGDVMMAAELVTPEDINFLATHGIPRRFQRRRLRPGIEALTRVWLVLA
jgi:hypothetical protein